MRTISKLAAGAFALVALAGCYYPGDRPGYYDRYGPGPGYDGYYDGYYGPYYGGYWGGDGVFYYYDRDHHYHPDADHHFRHEQFEGGHQFHADHDGDNWHDGDHWDRH